MIPKRKIQFTYDFLADQIVDGRKTASVATLDEAFVDENPFNQALQVGTYYDVYTQDFRRKCIIRIVAMELCRWAHIPERLWRGETNNSADEFRADHIDYFGNPNDDYEFIAYYFERIENGVQ